MHDTAIEPNNTIRFVDGVVSRLKSASKKRLQILLSPQDYTRLKKLQERVDPHTQTEAVGTALQVLEGVIDVYDKGGVFYISTDGGKTVEEFEILS